MNFSNSMGDLIQAIHRKEIKTVSEILFKNPRLLKNHDWKFLPLMNAMLLDNNEEIVEILLQSGADANLQNPLKVALEKGSVRCIELLLKNGAKLQGSQWTETSAAQVVFGRPTNLTDRKEILQLLFKYDELRNKKGDNVLHQFVRSARDSDHDVVEIAQFLIDDQGVSFNEKNFNALPILHSALFAPTNYELISYLIRKGADVNKKIEIGHFLWAGDSPLFFATGYSYSPLIVDLLISNGADIDYVNHCGDTLLHSACGALCEKTISYLIRKGFNVSTESYDEMTPLALLISFDDYIDDAYNLCVTVMMKEFAKLDIENQTISQKDMKLIQNNSEILKLFESSKNELSQLKNRIFFPPYSYYSVLKMSENIKRLAKLTMNEEFVEEFQKGLSFSYYKDDLQIIFNEAVQHKDIFVTVCTKLKSIFGNLFPDLVIEKLAKNFKVEDLPVE